MIRIHSDPDWCSPKATQPRWSAVAVGSHGPWEISYVCLAKPLACSCPLPHLLTDHGTWFHSTTFHLGWPGSEVTVTTKSMSQYASCALLSLTTVLGRLFCVHARGADKILQGGQLKEERLLYLTVSLMVPQSGSHRDRSLKYQSSEVSADLLLSLLSPFMQDKSPSLGNGTANFQPGSAYTRQCNEENSPQACPQVCLLDDSQLNWPLTQTITKGHGLPILQCCKDPGRCKPQFTTLPFAKSFLLENYTAEFKTKQLANISSCVS